MTHMNETSIPLNHHLKRHLPLKMAAHLDQLSLVLRSYAITFDGLE